MGPIPPHRKQNALRLASAHVKRPFDNLDSFYKSSRNQRRDRHAMYRRFVFFALAVLLAYAPIDNALAGHASGNQSRTAHASPRHAMSPRHHPRGSDGSNESYRSQRLRAKSEWRQALHRGNTSAPLQTVTQ